MGGLKKSVFLKTLLLHVIFLTSIFGFLEKDVQAFFVVCLLVFHLFVSGGITSAA